MTRLRVILIATLAASSIIAVWPAYAGSDDFKRGFQHGYHAANPGSLLPLTPLKPLPELGQSEYESGIAEGYKQGRSDSGENDRSNGDDE